MPPRKSKKTRVQNQQKKKQGKRTRRSTKAKKTTEPVVASDAVAADANSYLATINNNDFVVVDKNESIPATKSQEYPDKIVVGKIYANWCGHCESMKDAWEELKGKLDEKIYFVLETEETELPSHLDEINDAYLKNSTEKLAANGYPTIYRIEKHMLKYYDGDRTTDAMYDWFVIQKGGLNDKTQDEAKQQKKEEQEQKKGWFSWW